MCIGNKFCKCNSRQGVPDMPETKWNADGSPDFSQFSDNQDARILINQEFEAIRQRDENRFKEKFDNSNGTIGMPILKYDYKTNETFYE